MAVTKRVRFEVLRRDGHRCRYCGAGVEDTTLTVDHVIPVSLGGSDTPGNLVAACRDCNAGKASSHPDAQLVDDVSATAMRYHRALVEVAAMRQREREDAADFIAEFEDFWDEWSDPSGNRVWRDADWDRSILQMRTAGLAVADMQEMVEVAMRSKSRDKWRYFCGCCWARIRENSDLALSAIERDS